jgi:hypothetical protein
VWIVPQLSITIGSKRDHSKNQKGPLAPTGYGKGPVPDLTCRSRATLASPALAPIGRHMTARRNRTHQLLPGVVQGPSRAPCPAGARRHTPELENTPLPCARGQDRSLPKRARSFAAKSTRLTGHPFRQFTVPPCWPLFGRLNSNSGRLHLLKPLHRAGLDQEPIETPGLRAPRAAVEQAIAALQYLLLF